MLFFLLDHQLIEKNREMLTLSKYYLLFIFPMSVFIETVWCNHISVFKQDGNCTCFLSLFAIHYLFVFEETCMV